MIMGRLHCWAPPAAVMGILNATPDSFSDGGRHLDHTVALRAAREMRQAGAAWLDVGGESTRPGAAPVSVDEELRRVVPLVQALAAEGLGPISVDTSKGQVAAAALDAGACLVNDVTAGADEALLAAVAAHRAGLCLMHMQGEPRIMQDAPNYADVVAEVMDFLAARIERAIAAGVPRTAIVVDPGIGFGKTLSHNLALLRGLGHIAAALHRPVLVGLSRKRMISGMQGQDIPAVERDALSHLVHVQVAGACGMLRVHDVPGAVRALRMGLWRSDL